MSGDHKVEEDNPGHSGKPYSLKDDMTTGILVVEGETLFVSSDLLSLYSPVFKELFTNAEKGVVEELPVVKLENESATDIRTLLDIIYPDTCQDVDDGNLCTIVRLSTKFNIKRLRYGCIQYIKSKPQPKLIYRQLADKFDMDELSERLADSQLAAEIPTTDIEKEIAECVRFFNTSESFFCSVSAKQLLQFKLIRAVCSGVVKPQRSPTALGYGQTPTQRLRKTLGGMLKQSFLTDGACKMEEGTQCKEPYSLKDDMTSGILMVQGTRLYVTKELLSLYSPVLKGKFLKAEKGVVEELPIVKIEGESVADIKTLLDLLYPDTDKLIDDSNIYTIVRLSNKYNIKRLINDSVRFIKAQEQPKLLYRQLMDEFGLDELEHLTDDQLNRRIRTASIKREIKECPHLDPRVALRAAIFKLESHGLK